LTEQQGVYFVYEKIDEEGYRKLPVTIGESDGKRVVIKSGLKGGEAIVTEGAMTVRLAESSGVAIEGHNHNH
jgi:multidrug efflux pump subunit AcrA (membrane-fusion protein)